MTIGNKTKGGAVMLGRRKSRDQNQRGWLILAGIGAVAGAAWLYTRARWTIPVEETTLDVDLIQPSPHLLEPGNFWGDRAVQMISSGSGSLYHRYYEVDVIAPKLDKEAMMALVQQEVNRFVPIELARFERLRGEEGHFAQGDEFFIRITGPWDGPVRVIDVKPLSFSFITLEGHLEAGEIQFMFTDHPDRDDAFRFVIRSWARSSNPVTDFFYQRLGLSKMAQTQMWTYFCEAVVKESGGEAQDKIRVITHKAPYTPPTTEPPPAWKQYESQFDYWRKAAPNFDPSKTEEFTEANGWHIDDYAIGLPSEPPGEPETGGAWDAAKSIVMNYEFPDPGLITGIFVPDQPLEERIMILRARFYVFTFRFGVHITDVINEIRDGGKRGQARVWGYSYRTLSGHFEMGEISFGVWKYLESGEVEFRVHAYSKVAEIENPFYRLGFALFGRSLQRRFARTALERMQKLVLERLAKRPTTTPIATPTVEPLQADPAAEQLAASIDANAEKVGSPSLDANPAAQELADAIDQQVAQSPSQTPPIEQK